MTVLAAAAVAADAILKFRSTFEFVLRELDSLSRKHAVTNYVIGAWNPQSTDPKRKDPALEGGISQHLPQVSNWSSNPQSPKTPQEEESGSNPT